MTHHFSREELYESVWSKPMSKLAKELGVSDVGLAKACRRADIPVPVRGYWAKLQHRKKVRQTPLPPPTPTTPAVVQISPGLSNPLRTLAPEVQEMIARESTEEWRVTVPKTLSNPHTIVRMWLLENKNRREANRSPYGHTHQLRGNARCERRRLRILSALFGALERRGHQVVWNPQNPHDVALIVDGERLEFSLAQRQKQFKEDLTPEELRNPLNTSLGIKSRTILRPTDTLVFKIQSWIGMGMRTQWRDGTRGPLEEHLNDIVAGLLAAAATIRRQRLEREEEQRCLLAKRMERERQEEAQRKEGQRLKGLLQQVERWRRATDLRAYVEAVRKATKAGRSEVDQARLDEWASWALTQADRMDPLVSRDALAFDPHQNPEKPVFGPGNGDR